MSDDREFAERLAWARAEAGMTQKELAQGAKISLVQIARYEGGKSKPRLGAALKLARVLKMDVYDLVPELKKTTHEIEVEFSSDEAKFLDETAAGIGISTEELIRKITIYSLRAKARDPEFRRMINEDEPGLMERFDALDIDGDEGDEEEFVQSIKAIDKGI